MNGYTFDLKAGARPKQERFPGFDDGRYFLTLILPCGRVVWSCLSTEVQRPNFIHFPSVKSQSDSRVVLPTHHQ